LADSWRELLVQDQLAVLLRFTKGWALKLLLLVPHSTSAVLAMPAPVVVALAVVVLAVSLPPPPQAASPAPVRVVKTAKASAVLGRWRAEGLMGFMGRPVEAKGRGDGRAGWCAQGFVEGA
jgi:hypothetical protein